MEIYNALMYIMFTFLKDSADSAIFSKTALFPDSLIPLDAGSTGSLASAGNWHFVFCPTLQATQATFRHRYI